VSVEPGDVHESILSSALVCILRKDFATFLYNFVVYISLVTTYRREVLQIVMLFTRNISANAFLYFCSICNYLFPLLSLLFSGNKIIYTGCFYHLTLQNLHNFYSWKQLYETFWTVLHAWEVSPIRLVPMKNLPQVSQVTISTGISSKTSCRKGNKALLV
jgi:hypothetical protein